MWAETQLKNLIPNIQVELCVVLPLHLYSLCTQIVSQEEKANDAKQVCLQTPQAWEAREESAALAGCWVPTVRRRALPMLFSWLSWHSAQLGQKTKGWVLQRWNE